MRKRKKCHQKQNVFVTIIVNLQIQENCYNTYNNGGCVIVGNYNNNNGNITVNEEKKIFIDKNCLRETVYKAISQNKTLQYKRK